jgi:hypothetical protein
MPRAIIFACALPLIGGCSDPVERLKADLRAHLASESPDLVLGDLRILSRTDADAVVDARVLRFVRGPRPDELGRLLHLTRSAAGWRVQRDLWKDFAEEAKREAFKRELWTRMNGRLRERFQRDAKPTTDLPQTLDVRPEGAGVVGTIQIQYNLKIPGDPERRFDFVYIEKHRYDPGRGWTFDSLSLHEQVAR